LSSPRAQAPIPCHNYSSAFVNNGGYLNMNNHRLVNNSQVPFNGGALSSAASSIREGPPTSAVSSGRNNYDYYHPNLTSVVSRLSTALTTVSKPPVQNPQVIINNQ